MPDPAPFPAGLPPGAARRLSVVGGALLASGIGAFLWKGHPKHFEWGVIGAVLGLGFLSLGFYLRSLVRSHRLEGFFLVTGDRREALVIDDAAESGQGPSVERGANCAVELSLALLRNAVIEGASCRLALLERSAGRHGDVFLYKKLREASADSPIADPSPRKGTRVRFAFLLKVPGDGSPTDERHRWEVTATVRARGVPDFSVAAPIRVL